VNVGPPACKRAHGVVRHRRVAPQVDDWPIRLQGRPSAIGPGRPEGAALPQPSSTDATSGRNRSRAVPGCSGTGARTHRAPVGRGLGWALRRRSDHSTTHPPS